MHRFTRPAAALTVLALALVTYALWARHQSAAVSGPRLTAPRPASAREHQAVNILVLGADGGDIHGNTDVIMLVRLDRERRTAWVLSVPRDSRVEIPGHGVHKINAANPLGGPDLTVATVSALVGAAVDHWVLVDFKGAARIIDRLGGVTIDVPVDMHKDDPTQNLHIHIKKGRQHLDGEQAVNFARFRGLVMGDISRTQNQQLLIREMARQLMASATIDRLPGLIPELWRSVRTDIGLTDAVRLASWFRGTRDWTVLTMTLPGNFQWIDGISYWGVDPAKARRAWSDFLQGRPTPLIDESLALGHPPAPRREAATVAGTAYAGGEPETSGTAPQAASAAPPRPAPGAPQPAPGAPGAAEEPSGQPAPDQPGAGQPSDQPVPGQASDQLGTGQQPPNQPGASQQPPDQPAGGQAPSGQPAPGQPGDAAAPPGR